MNEFTGSAASQADFIWKNAEDLWGDFKHTDFGKIILPFTLLRRLECALEPTREAVREAHDAFKDADVELDTILRSTAEYPFYNTSEYSLGTLGSTKTRRNLEDYIALFSDNARAIFEEFEFGNTVIRLEKAGLLYKICQNFAKIDLHPDVVPDRVMSNIYEHLIRRFGAEVNEGAEDFMTPRDIVHLATALLLDPDDALFEASPGLIRTLYDPTCGTGGFLTDAMNHVGDFYAACETGTLSRMLDYRTFGYRRIKVLRPLRMTLELDKVGMERLEAEAAWEKLSEAHQTFWREALKPLIGQTQPYSWAETFVRDAIKSVEAKQLKVKSSKTLITALINAFGHKDPKAEPVTDSNGELVPDTDLTDYENVPYLEDIDDYFTREVLPHVPDAWLDESFTDARDGQLGRVGYEINFNRFFYQYQPPRKLHDIDEDLKQVEAEIAALLAEVASE